MFFKGFDDNYLIWIILLFCLCGDNDIFDDIEDYLPLLLLLLCFCDGNILDDIEDYLPWLLVLLCCCYH